MNCLLWNQQFDSEQKLKEHYMNFHNADTFNCFLLKNVTKPINMLYNQSLFYLICYAICFVKSGKTNKCSDEKIEEVIGSDVYRKLKNEKEYLKLNLDYQKREKYVFKLTKYYQNMITF